VLKKMVRRIALAAVTAALYAGLTMALAPISFGVVQFRVAEALTLLPFIMPEAVPGLFVGCLLANFLGGFGIIDVVFGSAATLAAACLTYKMPSVWLAAVPPVVVNALVVGGYLSFITETPLFISVFYIAAGEAGVCFLLGVPLCRLLMRTKSFDTFLVVKKEKAPGLWVKK